MKKLLSLVLVIALIVLAFPTAALATDGSSDGSSGSEPDLAPFDFENLLTEECEVNADLNTKNLTGVLKQGFWFAASDSSSLDGILSTTTLNGIPVFLLDSPTKTTFMWPAAEASEKDKMLKLVMGSGGRWDYDSDYLRYPTSSPIRQTADSVRIGYTANLIFGMRGDISSNLMYLFICNNNMVYPVIMSYSDLSSDPAPTWDESWPKNNEELTAILREQLNTTEDYTFFTTPNFGSGKKKGHTNLLYLPLIAIAGEGGSITEQGEKIFRPGNIDQKYTVTANEGYTIYYVQVDGKTVQNSVNCGDTATFTFDCIYGPRSINAVFKKK
ncbi:MAG: hypothetical protein K0S22_1774 [Oscillospiraceae bacterium]|jgi:hypothetical protein|nr:hypothetical protein [Oscillospiraceae bacterium]